VFVHSRFIGNPPIDLEVMDPTFQGGSVTVVVVDLTAEEVDGAQGFLMVDGGLRTRPAW
jgi:hypothetical protein